MTAVETVEAKSRTETSAGTSSKAESAIQFAKQASKLAQFDPSQENEETGTTQAVEARFVTGQDAVIQTANGGRLPAVPVEEALKLNNLRNELEDKDPQDIVPVKTRSREARDGTVYGASPQSLPARGQDDQERPSVAPLSKSAAPSSTNPLFPPLPLYGPPTLLRALQCWTFRVSSFFLSLTFLLVVVLGSLFTAIPHAFSRTWSRITFRDPDRKRRFYSEERRRLVERREKEKKWNRHGQNPKIGGTDTPALERGAEGTQDRRNNEEESFIPTEGGLDPLVCDVAYYAREQGLDCETFHVQTEDGFLIELLHLYNPLNYTPRSASDREPHKPNLFPESVTEGIRKSGEGYAQPFPNQEKRYPVLLMHGLLQSAGAYCCTGESSLAFYLAKSGYDVWLGNNRCGFNPKHTVLKYSDPRMWAWNIRQMGVMDLPALVSRVLTETGFSKCALVAHSQGTTQTMVALAKEQRPELGPKLSCVCLLAPAAYAGPLLGKAHFKFVRFLNPAMFRMVFGIHSFIPLMMACHKYLPAKLYGFMGYRVFSFLFDWNDARWERDLRPRFFQFSPVYVSAESMRWWLGKECFAKHKCILATKRETRMEDEEDREHALEDEQVENGRPSSATTPNRARQMSELESERDRYAWYDESVPPLAFWVCGNDRLVDGRRLLKRFERGREPHVKVVHKKVIDEYEHLDVIWAMDSIEQVGREVADVIWKTVGEESKQVCRIPRLDRRVDAT